MNRPTRVNGRTASIAERSASGIGFSITNQRGEHSCCRARGVSLRIKRGIMQLVEGKRGCFVWFDRCRVELRDGHRTLSYRLLGGSASSDDAGLTIVAEVVGEIGGTVKRERTRGRLPRGSATGGTTKRKPPGNAADVMAA